MIRTRILITLLSLFSSIVSFAAYTVLLRYLGASESLDLLFYAASVPLAIAGVISGVQVYLFPPRFTQVSESAQESTFRILFVYSIIFCTLAIFFLILFSLLWGRLLLAILWAGFLIVALMLTVITLIICIAQVRGMYLLTAIAPMIISIGLLIGAVIAIATHTPWGLLVGQFVGTLVAALFLKRSLSLKMVCRRHDRILTKKTLDPLAPHSVAILLGTLSFTLFQPIDALLCSQLSQGSISLMAYAQRILVASATAVSLGAYTIAARTSYETLSIGGRPALIKFANIEIIRVVGFGVLLWLIYNLGGDHFFRVVLSSTVMAKSDLDRLIDCIRWMILGVGPMAATPYLFRVFYTLQNYSIPALIGTFIVVTYGLLGWYFTSYFGIFGLAYTYLIVWWIAFILSLILLNKFNLSSSVLTRG